MKSKQGFTLVELIIVVAVIGILAALMILVFPNSIKKANNASAVSDAKNVAKEYEIYASKSGKHSDEIVLLVMKADGAYVFGYSQENDLSKSASNPYDYTSTNEFFNALVEKNHIKAVAESSDITDEIGTSYNNVRVYSGYTLLELVNEITISETQIYVGEDEEYCIGASIDDIKNDKNIVWESSDEGIAKVKDGKVSGVAPGNVTITANCGNKSATCNVTVIGYTDFTGTLYELKDAIENSAIPLVMLRFCSDIQHVGSTNMLPITISNGKRVRITISDEKLSTEGRLCIYPDDDQNPLIVVDGGSLFMKADWITDFAIALYDRRSGTGDIEIKSDIIVNRNNGKVELNNIGIDRSSYLESGTATISGSAIRNESGECTLNKFLYSSSVVSENALVITESVLYNEKDATMNINQRATVECSNDENSCAIKTFIENHGECSIKAKSEDDDTDSEGTICAETPIVNYGNINTISNLKFLTSSNGTAIVSRGSDALIGKLENCLINSDSSMNMINPGKYCMEFSEGASIKYIAGCSCSFNDKLILADNASDKKLNGIIVSGQFSGIIPNKYIADGHRLTASGNTPFSTYYIVS